MIDVRAVLNTEQHVSLDAFTVGDRAEVVAYAIGVIKDLARQDLAAAEPRESFPDADAIESWMSEAGAAGDLVVCRTIDVLNEGGYNAQALYESTWNSEIASR